MRAATDERPRLQPQLQDDAACDTLDDLDIADTPSLKALHTAVLGAAIEQKDVCGVLLTGARVVGARDEATWGSAAYRFSPQSETWSIRSSPKGRIGKPLVPGELRKVAVMVRSRDGQTAKVTLLRLWLAQHALDAPATGAGRRREEATFGAHGVNFFGLHLFEHHGRTMLSAHPDQPGRDNYYVVNGSFVSVTEAAAAQGDKPRVVAVQPCPIAHIKIAFSLTGSDHAWPAMGPTPCARSSERGRFESRRTLMRAGFAERVVFAEQKRLSDAGGGDVVVRLPLSTVAALRHRATTLLAASEVLCEQVSCTGLLDATCDPFFAPVLPDALRRPNGALLIIAIAVRIACYPARFGLPESTSEDAVVAREASLLLEAVEGAVFPKGISDDNDEPIYAIDIVAAHTLQRFFEHVESMRSATPEDTGELDQVAARAQATLEALYCTGIGLCADVVGAELRADAAGTATMGPSESCRDPVQSAMAEAARARGLRPLCPRLAPVRGSTRGTQQTALVRTLLRVERWLRWGACEKGVVAPVQAVAVAAATATATLAHCFSPGTSPTPSPTPSSTTSTPTASDEAPTRDRAETQTVLAEAMRTAADDAAATKGGSKKKQRRALRQGARRVAATAARLGLQSASVRRLEDATMQSTMGARGRRRAHFETCLVDEILGSLRGMGAVTERLRLPNGVKLNGPTLDEASGVFSETLQCGATFVADFQAFLVSHGARNRCCDCEAVVGVAESVAFGGEHGACRNCRHPRCLSCAQRRTQRNDDGGDGALRRDDGDERCLFCGGEPRA